MHFTSYARIDPAQEIARIRQSVSLIESYIFPHQRNVTATRRTSDAALITPKKEPVEPDVSDKNATAPGMLGTQQQGGLYAGPTSAATHLLMVNLGGASQVKQLHPYSLVSFADAMLHHTRPKAVTQMILRVDSKVKIASMKTFHL